MRGARMHGARKKTCQALQRFQCHPQRKRHRRRPELHFGGHSLGGPALSWITDPSPPGREGRLQAEKRQVAEAGWKPPALQGRARPGMGRDTITQGQGLPSPGATRAREEFAADVPAVRSGPQPGEGRGSMHSGADLRHRNKAPGDSPALPV